MILLHRTRIIKKGIKLESKLIIIIIMVKILSYRVTFRLKAASQFLWRLCSLIFPTLYISVSGTPCWGTTLALGLRARMGEPKRCHSLLIQAFLLGCFTANRETVQGQCPTNCSLVVMTSLLPLPLCLFHSSSSLFFLSLFLVLPHLLAPLCNLCLCHLWHQPAHRHLCQAWQPKPRRSA